TSAAAKLAPERSGQMLGARALVDEAYLRPVDGDKTQLWNSRGHFIAAAAEAMRRILVENARRKKTEMRGGKRKRIDLSQADPGANAVDKMLVGSLVTPILSSVSPGDWPGVLQGAGRAGT